MNINDLIYSKPLKYKKSVEPTPCWVWQGHIMQNGYGRIKHKKKCYLVHRLSYTKYHGPILKNLEIDHLCHNRACFNPEHLEAVTHKENCLRGNVGRHLLERKQCPKGHSYSKSNTGYYINRDKQIRRVCRKCRT